MYARVMRKWSLKSKLMYLLWLTLVTMLLIVIAAPITATTAATASTTTTTATATNRTIIQTIRAARATRHNNTIHTTTTSTTTTSTLTSQAQTHTNGGDMLRTPHTPRLPASPTPTPTPSSLSPAAEAEAAKRLHAAAALRPPSIDNIPARMELRAPSPVAAVAVSALRQSRYDAGGVEESSYYIPVLDDAVDGDVQPPTRTATGAAGAVSANVASNIDANRLIYKVSNACDGNSNSNSSSNSSSSSCTSRSSDSSDSDNNSSTSSRSRSSSSSSRLFSNKNSNSNSNRLSNREKQKQLEAQTAGAEAAAAYADRLMYAAQYKMTPQLSTVFDEDTHTDTDDDADDGDSDADDEDDVEKEDAVEDEEELVVDRVGASRGGGGGRRVPAELSPVIADDDDDDGDGDGDGDEVDADVDDDDIGDDDKNEQQLGQNGEAVDGVERVAEQHRVPAIEETSRAASKQKVPNVKDSHVINLFNDKYNYNNHSNRREELEPAATFRQLMPHHFNRRRLPVQQQSLTLPPAAAASAPAPVGSVAPATSVVRSTKMRRHIQQELQLQQQQQRHYAPAATGDPQNYYNSPVRETVAMGSEGSGSGSRNSSSSSRGSSSGAKTGSNSNTTAATGATVTAASAAPGGAAPLPLRYIIEAFEISSAALPASGHFTEQQRRLLLHQQQLRRLRKMEQDAARSRRESRAFGQMRKHNVAGSGVASGSMGNMGSMGSASGGANIYQQHYFNAPPLPQSRQQPPQMQSQLQQPDLQPPLHLSSSGSSSNQQSHQHHHHQPQQHHQLLQEEPKQHYYSDYHRQHRQRQRQHRQHRQRQGQQERRPPHRYCSARDPAQLAFEAPTVVEGKIISMSPDRRANFSVSVEVQHVFKMQIGFEPPKYMRLQFAYRNTSGECDIYREQLRACGLVHGDELEAKRVYLMFLQQIGLSNFTILGQPIRKTKRVVEAVRNAVSENYAQLATIRSLTANNRTVMNGQKLEIICKVRGQPPPKVTWFKDHKSINRNRKLYQFIHLKKRSELVIRSFNSSDAGRYECRAKNKVNHNVERRTIVIKAYPAPRYDPPTGGTGNKCPDDASEFCFNGGTCNFFSEIGSYSCECPEGFIGERCDRKEVNNMPPNPTFKTGYIADDPGAYNNSRVARDRKTPALKVKRGSGFNELQQLNIS